MFFSRYRTNRNPTKISSDVSSSKEMDELDFPDLDYKIHADCSFPLSVPSQPPDIRNWFSSYQYESPDPSNPFHDLDETQDPLGGFEVQQQEDSPKFKEESCLKDDHILSKDSQNLVAATKRSDGKENGSIREEILKAPVSGLKRKQKVKHVLEEICTNDNGLPQNENSNNLKVEEDILQKKQSPKKCSNGEFIANASKDGFISTKKKERSRPSMPISINQENVKATSGVKRGGNYEHLMREALTEKNRILADKTNIQVEVEQGNTGKWQCPRKRKPYVGPPLKQLRLEQWVRRLN